jgi:hypothetical protein
VPSYRWDRLAHANRAEVYCLGMPQPILNRQGRVTM